MPEGIPIPVFVGGMLGCLFFGVLLGLGVAQIGGALWRTWRCRHQARDDHELEARSPTFATRSEASLVSRRPSDVRPSATPWRDQIQAFLHDVIIPSKSPPDWSNINILVIESARREEPQEQLSIPDDDHKCTYWLHFDIPERRWEEHLTEVQGVIVERDAATKSVVEFLDGKAVPKLRVRHLPEPGREFLKPCSCLGQLIDNGLRDWEDMAEPEGEPIHP
ncbi:hypothetical protein FALBO_11796 [Fusarium albosuccineum]|uniref:Uncharacterized protein n=1 Tax=Fusarium albosuccineum TaxID=1237068 RepID=A0A8H4L4K3_9HYPO|nr:hypothetical protein FALBO_11796 [Fusarium albosuccineum]